METRILLISEADLRVPSMCGSMEVSVWETCSLNPNPEQKGILQICRLTNKTSLQPGSLFGVPVPGLTCDLHVWTHLDQGYCIQFGILCGWKNWEIFSTVVVLLTNRLPQTAEICLYKQQCSRVNSTGFFGARNMSLPHLHLPRRLGAVGNEVKQWSHPESNVFRFIRPEHNTSGYAFLMGPISEPA